jgi:2-keto-myo-inositol isomerase
MKRSTVEEDLRLCEKYGYDYIELRLDMLKKYFTRRTVKDLAAFFASSRLKPYAFNSIEDINFRTGSDREAMLDLFRFGCETAQAIGNRSIVVVPTQGPDMQDKDKAAVFDDSVAVLTSLADIAKPYGVRLSFEPIGDKRWCVRSLEEGLAIVNAVNRVDVGLTLDSINMYMYNNLENFDSIDKVPL